MALVDRYVAISFPLLHREKMTVRLASAILLIAAISLTFLLKFVYIARMSPLRCEICLVHSKVLGFTVLLLFVSCILLNFTVYRKTRTLLRECRTLEIRNSDGIDGRVDGENIVATVNCFVNLYCQLHLFSYSRVSIML